MARGCLKALCILTYLCAPVFASPTQAGDIVQRSVANTNADWAAAPKYDFTEHDVITKHGSRSVKTYRVMMIDGSPYNKLIEVNNEKLTGARASEEDRKLQQEIARRRSESASARRKRVAEYQKERRQDHALMSEMVKAFDFSLAGQETVNGRRCFILNATPRSSYNPPSRETQVLKGMRGKMWVDTQEFQWVRVHAEVFRPVSFGLFIAHVKPGTEFTLEQSPVEGNLWLPSHFSVNVNATVLFWSHRSSDDETYSNYHLAGKPNVQQTSRR